MLYRTLNIRFDILKTKKLSFIGVLVLSDEYNVKKSA